MAKNLTGTSDSSAIGMPATLNILGSGAIGGLCAAVAQQANVQYRLLPRPGSQHLQSVLSQDGQLIALKPLATTPPSMLTSDDVLILPLKVFQLEAAMRSWQAKLCSQTPVVLLHNGMGGMELAHQYLPNNPVYLATTSHGALKTTPEQVQHTGQGRTMLGLSALHSSTAATNARISQLMEYCIGPVNWCDDILLALWQKLAVNCAINPLTARHNIRNGQLSEKTYRSTIEAITEEVCNVANACGVNLEYRHTLSQVFEVIHLTAANYSSMHQDVMHQRPTEIDAITGYILTQANKKGIDVATNTLLYNAIKNV